MVSPSHCVSVPAQLTTALLVVNVFAAIFRHLLVMTNRETDIVENGWQPDNYDDSHSFVYEYGADVVDICAPKSGERILDVGCGTGHLTATLAERGATVVGIDKSPEMVVAARENYPNLTFVEADATELDFDEPFDAAFSNATLHWIDDQDAVLSSIANVLRPGARFVAELGGDGNVASVVKAVTAELNQRGYEAQVPWYFPTLGAYTAQLEDHCFEPRYAVLFDRPTKLDENGGLREWLAMFGDSLLAPLPPTEHDAVVDAVKERLRPSLYRDGRWVVDYRRLRFRAVKRRC